jgi:glycosyltransferase involved in cell wall biosynthesis
MNNIAAKSRAYLETGMSGFIRKVTAKVFHTELVRYHRFLKGDRPSQETLLKQKAFSEKKDAPFLSIVVPLYRTKPAYLKALVTSVKASSYEKWELCLADGSGYKQSEQEYGAILRQLMAPSMGDVRIRYERLEQNLGIAGNTNAALAMARGEWMLFMDHDDTITEDALAEIAQATHEHPQAELIYSDEDKIHAGGGRGYDPHFKPDYDPVLLESVNYISHLTAVKRSLLERIGGLDAAYDGAQDYDFILRACEQAKEIVHIDRVLYHWRCHKTSTAKGLSAKAYAVDAGKRALAAHFERLYGKRSVEVRDGFAPGNYRSTFPVPEGTTLTILLWSDGGDEQQERSEMGHTGSGEKNEQSACPWAENAHWSVRRVRGEELHEAALAAQSTHLLFLKAGTTISEDAVRTLLGIVACGHVSAAGAMLIDEHHTIISAGQILGDEGTFDAFTGYPSMEVGYMGRAAMARSVSALPLHCLMISKALYEQSGGVTVEQSVRGECTYSVSAAALCKNLRAQAKTIACVPELRAELSEKPRTTGQQADNVQDAVIPDGMTQEHIKDAYYHRAFEPKSPGFLLRRRPR